MSTELKSNIFDSGFFKGDQLEAFKEDVQNIIDFKSAEFERIMDFVKRIIITESDKEEQELFSKAVESKLVNNKTTIISFHRLMTFFWSKFYDEKNKGDEPKTIIKDIANSINIDINELGSIEKLIELVKKESSWFDEYKLTNSISVGLFPFLKGIGTTVELRGVFNRQLKFGEKADDYMNSVKIYYDNPVTPVITIALTLDSGTPDRFCFQASPERIEWLIEELKASLYKMKILENTYKNQ